MRNARTRAGSRRAAPDEEHDDELWLVSYADMVTLLFGFFVILFSLSTLDDKKFDQMTAKVAESFQAKSAAKTPEVDPEPAVGSEARQLRALQMLVGIMNLGDSVDEAVAKIEASYGAGKAAEGAKAVLAETVAAAGVGLIASATPGQDADFHTVELVLPDSSLFPSGGYRLTPAATGKLVQLATELGRVADLAEIEVAGYTDSQAPAAGQLFDSNLTLSSLRAGAVASVLVRHGVDARKMTVRGMGSLRPLVPERDQRGRAIPANMARNRRVSVVLKVRNAHVPTSH